ncbi:sigma-70 family RNA polymerase sigma factor [Haloferula sp. A504]|uniref:sigma-70 family RNA polymerase sigma factor n=1 Tax=Haloferula sp. A504 TaxID=3373601 RepID=UPI0031C678A4|nr:sigma-70 family RNA polymerase sigma factor [Verrucomicrobiaceae bacterium E54]
MADDLQEQSRFVGLIARHQAALHAYIISLMPGVDGVDDVLQETNLVLWEKRKSFREGTNFKAWACQIARYKVMSHRRRLANFGRPVFDDDLAEMLAAECEAEPEELDVRMEALRKCLGRLRDKERELINHRYFSNDGLEAFAEKRGQSVETLRVTLFRIRAALRKCITGVMNIDRARS